MTFPRTTTEVPPGSPTEADLWPGHSRFLAFWEGGCHLGLVICAAITMLTTAGIILVLGRRATSSSRDPQVGLSEFLFGTELMPDAVPPRFGIVPLMWGTFMVAAGASMIGASDRPFERDLSERDTPRPVRAVLKPTLELLAGIPTIVYGYVALLLVTPDLKLPARAAGLASRDVQCAFGLHRGRGDDHSAGVVA